MSSPYIDTPPCKREGCILKGQPHPRCIGHTDRDGAWRPCNSWPVRGLNICVKHGANKAARAKGARVVALQEAQRVVRTLGRPINVSPTQALIDEVRWTAGHVAWLRGRVQELGEPVSSAAEDHALVWGRTSSVDRQATEFRGVDTTYEGKPSVWYELYLRERAHLIKACEAALRANIDERRVRIAEGQGQLVSDMLRRVLAAAFEMIIATLRAHGIADAVIVDTLRVAWQEFLAGEVPRQLRALAAAEIDAREDDDGQ